MSDLKPIYDRVLTAQGKVESVRNQIADAFALNTKEGDEQALALESTLDEAIAEEARFRALYDKAVNANKNAGTLKHFVPALAEEIPADGDVSKGKTMKRAEWQALASDERRKFIYSGGVLED